MNILLYNPVFFRNKSLFIFSIHSLNLFIINNKICENQLFCLSQEVDKVYDLLRTLHKICDVLWPDKTSNIVELHLLTILKMLQLPQFNPRMNAMKELSRLIKDAERHSSPDITVDAISKWLMDNKVLSIAFSSK